MAVDELSNFKFGNWFIKVAALTNPSDNPVLACAFSLVNTGPVDKHVAQKIWWAGNRITAIVADLSVALYISHVQTHRHSESCTVP